VQVHAVGVRDLTLPDNISRAGVPLRILLSDRSGPGALLRDSLIHTRSVIKPST
jgi:hypothetical protein